MQKSYLAIFLNHHGRAVWQVRQEVPAEDCRRMTTAELEAIGVQAARALADIIRDSPDSSDLLTTDRAPVKDTKKKRKEVV
jgi:hypothetical protein